MSKKVTVTIAWVLIALVTIGLFVLLAVDLTLPPRFEINNSKLIVKDSYRTEIDLTNAQLSLSSDKFELHNDKVDVKLETSLKEITDNGVIVTDKQGKEYEILGDSVIMSVGYVPYPIDSKAKLVGDCKAVGNLRTVIQRAWDIAMKI